MSGSVATVESLQTQLQRDLTWRKKEIVSLRGAANRSDNDRHYVYRAGLVMIFAHWEGYLKTAATLYVRHVFAQRLPLGHLASVFVAHAFFSDVQKCSNSLFPGSEQTHVALANRILEGTAEVATGSTWSVDTASNPSTEVLDRILRSLGLAADLGLDGATWSATRVFINEKVVADRHKVAHGEGFRIDKMEFLSRSARMLALLDTLSEQILNAAQSRAYLRTANPE